MADTLKFGPEWLRQLSTGGSMTSPPPSPAFGGKFKLAEYRYGREEMLALFHPNAKAPDDLRQFSAILVERCQDPMALIAPTEEEQRLLHSNVNSNLAYRQVAGRGGGGMRGAARGGGVSSIRGRGRGRGDSSGYFQRGGFDDGLPVRDGSRGRGGGSQKVIERDASGFLSARTFDESTDRRSKDPYARSAPGDRWSELRTTPRDMTAVKSGTAGDTPTDESSSAPGTPLDAVGREDLWRRAGKDSQPRGSWRDAKPSFDDDPSRYQRSNSGFGRQISYERSRSYRQDEDELPEWATDDMGGSDEGGTFDASGAFMSLKGAGDRSQSKSQSKSQPNGDNRKTGRKEEINKAKKALPPLSINSHTPSTTSTQLPTPSKESHSKQEQQADVATPTTTSSASFPKPNASGTSSSTDKVKVTSSMATPSADNPSSQKILPHASATVQPSVDHIETGDTKTPGQESADGKEDIHEHLTIAAEEMMATWSNEDERQSLPAAATSSAMTLGMSDMLKHQVLQQRAQVPLEQPDLTSSVELYEHWFYQDPQGKLQGPFTAQEMAEWFSAGYFTMNLPVKQGKGRVFQPLGEIFKRCGNGQPFVSTPTTPSNSIINRLASGDPTLMVSSQETIQQQALYLQRQQALIQQQQQQMAILKQHQQIEELMATLEGREEFSQLSKQQLREAAVKLWNDRRQVMMAQQTLIDANRAGPFPMNKQSSPPQMALPSAVPPTHQDEDMLWGMAANPSWKQQMTAEEIAHKEAARHEQQLLEVERQREQEKQLKIVEEKRAAELLAAQQRLVEQRAAEQRLAEQRLAEQRLAEQMAAEQRLAEQRRLMEEKAKEERRKQIEEMEKQKKEEEERKRQEIEKQEQEKKRQKEKQIELERKMELERKKILEMEKQKEVERKIAQEAKRKAELQKRQEEEDRKQKEAMEAEKARIAQQRLLEQEKAEKELLAAEKEKERERQVERERLEALKLPSTAQWASNNRNAAVQGMNRQLSLQEIQKREKEEAEKEKAANLVKQQQLLEQQSQQQQGQLKWAAPKNNRSPVTVGKSLREIQEEEAIRLEKERKEKQRAAPAPAAVAATGSTWSSGKSLAGGWASEGAWGAAVRNGLWDQPSSNKSPRAPNSEVFPSLSAATKSHQVSSTQQAKKKSQPAAQKKVAQNDHVKQLFQKEMSSDDQFNEWCVRALKGLNSSVDVPTFVSFLRDVESPYDVQDYVKSYLGETAKSMQFAKDFIEKRSVAKKKQAQQRLEDEDNLWGPAPAVNPPTHRTSDSPSNQVANDKKKKAVRKNKGGKMDATALLGFTVGASSHRLNVGEIEKAE